MADPVRLTGGSLGAMALGTFTVTATPPIYSSPQPSYSVADFAAPKAAKTTSKGSRVTVSETLLNAKLEAVEARTDSKFAQLIGKIDTLGERLSGVSDKIGTLDAKVATVDGHVRNVKGTIVAVIIGTGIAVAALAYSAVQVFQGGLGASASAFQTGIAVGQTKK